MNNEAIIHFDKVVKRFGPVTVLDELDFEVRKGEKVSIIGPSGSGKSTVLRILMTLETIDDGVIHVAGRPLWHEQPAKRICGPCARKWAWSFSSSISSPT